MVNPAGLTITANARSKTYGQALTLGTTAFTSEWLMARLARHRALMVVSVTERGWGDHLDVVAISAQDVHHRQKDLSVGRRPTMGD